MVVQKPSIVTVTTASANTDLARWVTDVENTNKCLGMLYEQVQINNGKII